MKHKTNIQVFILIMITLFFSCNKNTIDGVDKTDASFIEKKFNYKDFKNQLGDSVSVDFSNLKKDTMLYLGLPEIYFTATIKNAQDKNLGKIFFKVNSDSGISSLVVKTDRYDRRSGEGEIAYIGVGLERYVVLKITKNKIVDYADMYFEDENRISTNSLVKNANPTCTATCYKQAKDACDSDPDCKILCDNLTTCNGTIAVACFMHCMFK